MAHHHISTVDLLLLISSLGAITTIAWLAIQSRFCQTWPRRTALLGVCLILAALALAGFVITFPRFQTALPNLWAVCVGASATFEAAALASLALALLIWRNLPQDNLPRRRFLKATGASLAVAPYVGTTFGILVRNRFSIQEVKIRIPNLHKDLQGLRLVQITDIHLSPFLSERELARAIDMANETKAHLALVTGDLITRPGDPIDACLRQLARLRSAAGALGCMGNHESYTQTIEYVQKQGKRIGIDFLRSEARTLRFGGAAINFAGVDYQPFHEPYLRGAEKLAVPGMVNVLLSHNPDVFPVAMKQGFDVTIAGHTHGGQVNVEILHHNMNFARTFTPFVRGLYEQGGSSIYVCSGIGTIGVPVRVGAPPEVALIQLCAS